MSSAGAMGKLVMQALQKGAMKPVLQLIGEQGESRFMVKRLVVSQVA